MEHADHSQERGKRGNSGEWYASAMPARGEGEPSEEVRSDEIARAHHERRRARSHWPGEQPLRVIWEQIEDHAGGQKHRYENYRGYSGSAQYSVVAHRRSVSWPVLGRYFQGHLLSTVASTSRDGCTLTIDV